MSMKSPYPYTVECAGKSHTFEDVWSAESWARIRCQATKEAAVVMFVFARNPVLTYDYDYVGGCATLLDKG